MKHTFLPIFLALASSFCFADEPIGLNELTRKALAGHPSLADARSDIDSAKAQRAGLLAPFQPQFSVNAYGTTGSGSMIFPGTIEPTNYALLPRDFAGVLNGTFMWRLFTFGREKDLAASGSAKIRSSEAALNAEMLDVMFSVRMAFADALLKRQTTLGHHAAHESAVEILRVTEAQFDAGKVPEAFVLKAKADLAAAEREVAMAEADETGSIAALWDAAGMEQSDVKELGAWDAELSVPPSVLDALNFAMGHRPELAGLEEQKKQMRSLASAAGKSGRPELSVMGMNDWSGSRGNAGVDTYKVGLVMSVPLGDGGQRRAASQEALATEIKADAGLRATRNHIQAEVVSAWAQWQSVAKVSNAAKAELAASVSAYQVALLRYQAGKSILAELTESRSQLTHANLAVAESKAYERKAWSKLERAIGRNLRP